MRAGEDQGLAKGVFFSSKAMGVPHSGHFTRFILLENYIRKGYSFSELHFIIQASLNAWLSLSSFKLA